MCMHIATCISRRSEALNTSYTPKSVVHKLTDRNKNLQHCRRLARETFRPSPHSRLKYSFQILVLFPMGGAEIASCNCTIARR